MNDILGCFCHDECKIYLDDKVIECDDLIVFIKGKIFNSTELSHKYEIKYKNDEELIGKLYGKVGMDFVKELDGNFAIVIYDMIKSKLYIVKDKLGIAFLYYYYKEGNFIFSTSLKLMMNHKNFVKKIDKQVLANFFGYKYIYEPYTIFENTYKVKKGSYILYQSGNIDEIMYFNLYDEFKKTKLRKRVSDDELIKEFSNLFMKSLEKLGNKESNVGVLMSRGRDSTLLAKLSKNFFANVNTYTLSYDDGSGEGKDAEEIADYIKTNHHLYEINKEEAIKMLEDIAEIYEEPFADNAILNCMYLFKNIPSDNDDFIITGDGCDNVFADSKRYKNDLKHRMALIHLKLIDKMKHRRYYKNFSEKVQKNVMNRFKVSDKLVGIEGQCKKVPKVGGYIRSIVIFELLNLLPEQGVAKIKALSNYYNIKTYAPFLDVDIITRTFSVPLRKLVQNGKGRYILKKILYQNIPNSYYSNYKKSSFGIPVEDWSKNIFLDRVKEISSEDFIKKQNLFDYTELMEFIKNFEQKPTYTKSDIIWTYYCFQIWYMKNMGE